MTTPVHPELDLTVSRIIRAPRAAVWNAWTDPASFEQWWVPAPEVCRVREMDLRPGGSFRTEISQDGTEFGPHITATAMHRNVADRDQHEQLGFHDGWGTVTRQLAELVESRMAEAADLLGRGGWVQHGGSRPGLTHGSSRRHRLKPDDQIEKSLGLLRTVARRLDETREDFLIPNS